MRKCLILAAVAVLFATTLAAPAAADHADFQMPADVGLAFSVSMSSGAEPGAADCSTRPPRDWPYRSHPKRYWWMGGSTTSVMMGVGYFEACGEVDPTQVLCGHGAGRGKGTITWERGSYGHDDVMVIEGLSWPDTGGSVSAVTARATVMGQAGTLVGYIWFKDALSKCYDPYWNELVDIHWTWTPDEPWTPDSA